MRRNSGDLPAYLVLPSLDHPVVILYSSCTDPVLIRLGSSGIHSSWKAGRLSDWLATLHRGENETRALLQTESERFKFRIPKLFGYSGKFRVGYNLLAMNEGMLLNNRYQLLERLGSGGMSDVFRARDLMLERSVAIKVLHEDYSNDNAFQQRFRQEARAAANLSHPNIVTVHDFGLDHGQLFIVMEYLPGKDLKTLLRQRGRFSVDDAIPLMVQACAGIGYAHRAGLVHCDVKPHNMIVTPDARLKVTDFGIARALSTILPDERADVVWGSPQYFSPEQASGEAPSPASDVYSLGVVLYEVLTGALPFTAPTSEELARMHLETPPIPPSEYVPEIPTALEQIVLKVLSKEPAARYRTADQLGRVLLRFGNERDAAPVPSLSLTPEAAPTYQRQASRPEPTAPPPVVNAPETTIRLPDLSAPDIDWASVGLGLLALMAVGGLIPFWIYIFFLYNPR